MARREEKRLEGMKIEMKPKKVNLTMNIDKIGILRKNIDDDPRQDSSGPL